MKRSTERGIWFIVKAAAVAGATVGAIRFGPQIVAQIKAQMNQWFPGNGGGAAAGNDCATGNCTRGFSNETIAVKDRTPSAQNTVQVSPSASAGIPESFIKMNWDYWESRYDELGMKPPEIFKYAPPMLDDRAALPL